MEINKDYKIEEETLQYYTIISVKLAPVDGSTIRVTYTILLYSLHWVVTTYLTFLCICICKILTNYVFIIRTNCILSQIL